MKRRVFLKGGLTTGALAVAVGAGLVQPRELLAAWPKDAFEAKSAPDALKGIYGADMTTASDKVVINAPEIAENGAVVPVGVTTTLEKVTNIAMLVEQNQNPLTASFNLGATAIPNISTRIKMGKTSNVIVTVKTADGKVYAARKEVKVTIGGCGG